MIDVKKELFLSEHFQFCAALDGLCDPEKIFGVLCRIYGVSDEEKTELFELANAEALREILSEADFKRYRRIEQYNQKTGAAPLCSHEEEQLIVIKGNALTAMARSGLLAKDGRTEAMIVNNLMERAQSGICAAMKILGVLQCEGLALPKNPEQGVKRLTSAARWGDHAAAMALFCYSESDRNECMKLLLSAVKDTPYDFLSALAEERYGVDAGQGFSKEARLVRRAISAGILKAGLFQPMYARLLFSRVIGLREKEQILFSPDQGRIFEACDLPLQLKSGLPSIDPAAFDEIFPERKEEKRRVLRGLSELEFLKDGQLPPMCLSSKSDYVLERYEAAVFRALSDAHVVRVDLRDLHAQDIAPVGDNAFLREIREREVNLFLLVFQGEIDSEVMDAAKTLLAGKKRKRFHLKQPTLDLDLSDLLLVCFCDAENAKALKSVTELVELAPLSKEEKPEAVRASVQKTCARYRLDEVRLAQDLEDRLCGLSPETVEQVLDCVVRENRDKGKSLELDLELTTPCIRKITAGGNTIGFGGNYYENE